MYSRYGFFGNPRYSSAPPHLTAPNGLNLTRSITNPLSRFNKVRDYLLVKGEATKVEILRDVFGKVVGTNGWRAGEVTRGWGSYLFVLSVKNGYFTKVRRGNNVFYSVSNRNV